MKLFKRLMAGFDTFDGDKQKYLYEYRFTKEGVKEFEEMFGFWLENKEALKKLFEKKDLLAELIEEFLKEK